MCSPEQGFYQSQPHHHKAKLNPELVSQFRQEAHDDPSISLYTFAARAGVSRVAMSNALYGISYKTLAVPPLDKYRRPKSRQQHPQYQPKGDKRIIARQYLPSCKDCEHFVTDEPPSCAANRARNHIKSFPYLHTRCKYYEEAK